MKNKFYKVKELAELLKISESKVRSFLKTGELKKSVWLNGDIIVYKKDLLIFLTNKGIKL